MHEKVALIFQLQEGIIFSNTNSLFYFLLNFMLALPPKTVIVNYKEIVSLGVAKYYQNISNSSKSMKLGRMVHIDFTNKLSLVGGMNYGYEGQRTRSSRSRLKKQVILEYIFKYVMHGIKLKSRTFAIDLNIENRRSYVKVTLKLGQRSFYLYQLCYSNVSRVIYKIKIL